MLKQIQSKLGPIRFRQRCYRSIDWSITGLTAGAALGIVLLLSVWVGTPATLGDALLLATGCTIAGALFGFAWPTAWHASARLVDATYQLKDRTVTALEFACSQQADGSRLLRRLQLQDAIAHLNDVNAKQVVRWRSPKLVPVAATLLVCMIVVALFGMPPIETQANVPRGPLPVVQQEADTLEETLVAELDKLAKETDDLELQQLAEQMRTRVEALKQPDVDQREALAQLSEMQAKLNDVMKQLGVQQMDAQLQQVAEALSAADATRAASQSLQAKDYQQAAEKLEKIQSSTMNRKQRDAVSQNLAKASSQLGAGQAGELSDSIQQIIDGLNKSNSSRCKTGFSRLAGVCRKQSVRKKISQCLGCQLNRLAACKGRCQGNGSSVAKSERPTNSAGRGASENPTGDNATQLDSQRREQRLTGISGDGPSERETMSTTEARQDATRSYRERYTEFRKQMEQVIDREPLPLGHRETVRTYFEAIRPNSIEDAEVAVEQASAAQ